MGWFDVFTSIAKKLYKHKDEIEELATELADIYLAHKEAKEDETITVGEWIAIGKEAYEAGEAGYELTKKMGWRK